MSQSDDFKVIYQELKDIYCNSGDLASALLPFICHTGDFKLAAAMLHSHIALCDLPGA